MNTNISVKQSKADSARWIALGLLAATQFMLVLDGMILNIALPSIQTALNFSQQNLQWVVNAYILVFGGFLLLGGRIGDLLGRRKVFIVGLLLFSTASLAGGLAQSDLWLIIARAVQGLGGAIISPAALSLLTTSFKEGKERDFALGIFGSTAGSGAACGVLLGGILTQFLGWQWVLFINFPLGLLVAFLSSRYLEESKAETSERSFDIVGAVLITVGLASLVYALVQTNENGWTSPRTIILFAIAAVFTGIFAFIETHKKAPLVDFSIFRMRSLLVANIVGILFACCLGGTIFLLSLYFQEVLHYTALESGLAFMPFAIGTIIASNLSSRFVSRLGLKPVLLIGLTLLAVGAFLLAQIKANGTFVTDILPGSLIFAFGLTGSAVPITIAAVAGVKGEQAGLASGLINTTQQIGFALGLAILATVATSRTLDYSQQHSSAQVTSPEALTSGYQLAFMFGFGFAALALILALLLLPGKSKQAPAIATDQTENRQDFEKRQEVATTFPK